MSEHINMNQWIRYFGRKATEDEEMQILRHVAECETCRNLMNKANDFRFALERQKQAVRSLFETEGMEYAAVAGIDPASEESSEDGVLIIELMQTETGYLFAEDTLEIVGAGKKYIMNCSEDCRDLTDEGGALSVLIRDNQLILKMTDRYMHGFASLTCQPDESGVEISAETVIPLPVAGSCSLLITFEEE